MERLNRLRLTQLLAAILIAAQVALCEAPVQAAPPPESTVVHVVRLGETLSLIARRYNTTVRAIAELNGMVNPNLIHVGQRLLIPTADDSSSPPSSTPIYIVQPGDTLTRIASRYGTTVSAIVVANDFANPSLILVGQRLAIPSSVPSASLPSPFSVLELKPLPVTQGQTLAIKVQTDGAAYLTGSFDNRPVTFVGENGQSFAHAQDKLGNEAQ